MSNNTSSTIESRVAIIRTRYDVTIDDEGTISWSSSSGSAFNMFELLMLVASFVNRTSAGSEADHLRILSDIAGKADIQLRDEKLELADAAAFRSIGEVTIYNDGFVRVSGSQCGRMNIFSLATRLAELAGKLRKTVRG